MLPMRWGCLFRDGRYIEQPEDDKYSKFDIESEWSPSSWMDMNDYLFGSVDNPKRHYPIWFKLRNNDNRVEYVVNFDEDGDCYIVCPDGHIVMDEYKIRSGLPYYRRNLARNIISGEVWVESFEVGYYGVDVMGQDRLTRVKVLPEGYIIMGEDESESVRVNQESRGMIKKSKELIERILYGSDCDLV